MKQQVELGDEVICRITGFKGLVVGIAKYLSGCDRADVRAPLSKDGKLGESYSLDIPALTVTKKGKVKMEDVQDKVKKGGPMSKPLGRI